MGDDTKQTVVLAAGGTGGHIFPAKALAEELTRHGHRVVLITDRRFAKYVTNFEDVEIRMIRAGSMSGGMLRRVLNLSNIGLGVLQAMNMLRSLKPAAVVGFGGYPSFPTMFAATLLKKRTIIHEQNSVLGRTNRFLADKVTAIATGFAQTSHVPRDAEKKVLFTGNPVRASIRALHDVPYPSLEANGKFNLLVMGGSQGAKVFSKILPEAVRLLPPALRARLRIDQQCREADMDEVRAAYDDMQVNANLATFFQDVPARLASTHLSVTRAGASTVAELLVAGRPSILVPLPSAMDDHQTYNANTVEDCGGGWLMPEEGFTAEALSGKLEHFLNLPSALTEAAAKARGAGKPDAAAKLAALVLQQQKQHQPSTQVEHAS